MLFVAGKSFGDGAWFWLNSFRNFYILHLLVLSGSQVDGISRLVRAVCGAWGLRPLLTLTLVSFAAATGWSAPITRATLLGILSLWLLRWNTIYLLGIAFGLQFLVFSSHRAEMGFYLSWIAYLVVVIMAKMRVSRVASTLFVSGILFLVVDTGFFGNPFRLREFLLCLIANLVFCTIFELVFMPFAAVFIVVALLLTVGHMVFGPEILVGGNFLAVWSDPLARLLLVVLKWLMYT